MAGEYNGWQIDQGMDWTKTVQFKNADDELINMTGATIVCTLKSLNGQTTTLSTANGKITIATTTTALALTESETALLFDSVQYRLTTSLAGVDRLRLYGSIELIRSL